MKLSTDAKGLPSFASGEYEPDMALCQWMRNNVSETLYSYYFFVCRVTSCMLATFRGMVISLVLQTMRYITSTMTSITSLKTDR